MNNLTMICGLHAVKSALHADPEKAVKLLLDRRRHDKRMQSIQDIAKRCNVPVMRIDRSELEQRSQGQVHQGVMLLTEASGIYHEQDIARLLLAAGDNPLVLVLDGITDPHNLGACLRTADAAGVAFAIAPRDRAAGLNMTVRKSASGAAEHLPFVQVTNLSRTLKKLQQAGFWITGTAMHGIQFYSADLTGSRVIIMGSEGRGMRRLTREYCDQIIHIPMQGSVENLNVSVATGIILYEAFRQRILQ